MVDLQVDITQVRETVTAMTSVFNNMQMYRIIHDTLSDTARKTKTIVKKTVAKEYQVTQKWAADQIGHYYTRGQFGVVIPLSGHRGTIGGTFPATTGTSGASTKSGSAAKRKVLKAAKIRRGKSSALSYASSSQGSGRIFVMASGKNKVALARNKGKLVRIVGRSLPQMVTESPSTETIGDEINAYMLKRVDHHIQRALNNFK